MTITNSIDTHIGAKLRKIRRSKDYILTDIAAILGVTFQQYRKYETGENRISAAGLWKIAQFYNMSMNEFLPKSSFEAIMNEVDALMEQIRGSNDT